MLRIGQRGIGTGIDLRLALAAVGHDFERVAATGALAARAQRLAAAAGAARGLAFGIVAAHYCFLRYALNQVAQPEVFDVLRQQHCHRLLFRQRGIILEDQLLADNLEGVAVLFG